jgi:DNA invertase Pin-like site-specific DNA recombinase
MRIGYKRVSSLDQNTARQLDGVPLDKVFEDHASGKDTARPQLRGVAVEFVKENMTFTGDSTPMAQFMLNIMGSFAELERAMILERQREGVALAKKAGKYLGRAPAIRSNNGKLAELQRLYTLSTPVAEMARQLKVSRQTIYSQLAALKQSEVAA